MSTYSNRLQPAVQYLLELAVRFPPEIDYWRTLSE